MIKRMILIRENKGMSQEKFAEKLGLSRNFINQVENGKKNISDRTVSDICREFNVNEVWLRTGEGGDENMFTKTSSEDRFSISLGKLTMTENAFIQNAINAFAETEPEKLKIVEEFMKKCLGIK